MYHCLPVPPWTRALSCCLPLGLGRTWRVDRCPWPGRHGPRLAMSRPLLVSRSPAPPVCSSLGTGARCRSHLPHWLWLSPSPSAEGSRRPRLARLSVTSVNLHPSRAQLWYGYTYKVRSGAARHGVFTVQHSLYGSGHTPLSGAARHGFWWVSRIHTHYFIVNHECRFNIYLMDDETCFTDISKIIEKNASAQTKYCIVPYFILAR